MWQVKGVILSMLLEPHFLQESPRHFLLEMAALEIRGSHSQSHKAVSKIPCRLSRHPQNARQHEHQAHP